MSTFSTDGMGKTAMPRVHLMLMGTVCTSTLDFRPVHAISSTYVEGGRITSGKCGMASSVQGMDGRSKSMSRNYLGHQIRKTVIDLRRYDWENTDENQPF